MTGSPHFNSEEDNKKSESFLEGDEKSNKLHLYPYPYTGSQYMYVRMYVCIYYGGMGIWNGIDVAEHINQDN